MLIPIDEVDDTADNQERWLSANDLSLFSVLIVMAGGDMGRVRALLGAHPSATS
jgi:hypothetical protein